MPTITAAPQASQSPQGDIVDKTKQYLQGKGQTASSSVEGAKGSPASSRVGTKSVSVKGMTSVIDAMFTKGIIDEQMLKSVKFESITSNTDPLVLLLRRGAATEDVVQQTKAEMYGLGFIDLSSVSISPEVLNKIPKDIASRNMAVPFEENSLRLKVGMEDPLDLQRIKFLESVAHKPIDAYYASHTALQGVIDTKYGAQIGSVVTRALEDIGGIDLDKEAAGGAESGLDQGSIERAPVAKIVNLILDYAIKHDASDVHIEPREAKLAVRFRIHGILSERLTLPTKLANSIVARIKILSNMKLDEHRIPQDNRFQVKAGEKAIDVRVSIMPSTFGEKVVMRLLEKGQGIKRIDELGLRGPGLKVYQDALRRTQGIILVTGPTGSGKTMTLAASLSILNTQEVNILTLEDPVEIRINGITQVQVNEEVGLTFATGLRAFLRQDPDIVMVGEIRDGETARLAVQAALTGHLVLSTLHTNSASGALPRLLDIGVEPYLLASTINLVGAQRLVRQLCNVCKQEYDAPPETVNILHSHLDRLNGFDLYTGGKQTLHFDSATKTVKLYKPVGCPKCGGEGYDGRIGIFEIMPMSEKIGRMIMENSSSGEIEKQAIADGMITMVEDGFMKALEGVTTIEEVIRVQN